MEEEEKEFLDQLNEGKLIYQSERSQGWDIYVIVDGISEDLIRSHRRKLGILKLASLKDSLDLAEKKKDCWIFGSREWFAGVDALIKRICNVAISDWEKAFWNAFALFLDELYGRWCCTDSDTVVAMNDLAMESGLLNWNLVFDTTEMSTRVLKYYHRVHSLFFRADHNVPELEEIENKIDTLQKYQDGDLDEEALKSSMSNLLIICKTPFLIGIKRELEIQNAQNLGISNVPAIDGQDASIAHDESEDALVTAYHPGARSRFFDWLYRDSDGGYVHRMSSCTGANIILQFDSDVYQRTIAVRKRLGLTLKETSHTLAYLLFAEKCQKDEGQALDAYRRFLQLCEIDSTTDTVPLRNVIMHWIVVKGKELLCETDEIMGIILSKDTHARDEVGETNDMIRRVLERMYSLRAKVTKEKYRLEEKHMSGITLAPDTTVEGIVSQLRTQFFRHVVHHSRDLNALQLLHKPTNSALDRINDELEAIVRKCVGSKPYLCMYSVYLQQILYGLAPVWREKIAEKKCEALNGISGKTIDQAMYAVFFEYCFFEHFQREFETE